MLPQFLELFRLCKAIDVAAYIAGWLRKLRYDRKLIIHAAAQAQRACDYILNAKAID
jgi:antirestriction protein ArdC